MEVVGGKSKKRYQMSVGDKGRSFKDDTGADMSEDDFKAKEGDYSTAGGSETVIKAGSYRNPDMTYRDVKAAPAATAAPPSLADAAEAERKKKELTTKDAAKALAARK